MKARKRGGKMEFTEMENVFFSRMIQLRAFPGRRRIGKGVYAVPFAVLLPRTLPSSLNLGKNRDRNGRFEIAYNLKVKMGREYTHDMPFNVKAAPLPSSTKSQWSLPTQYRMNPVIGPAGSSGNIVVGAMVQNHSVGRGDNLAIFLACRNDSGIDIKCIEIQIVEYVRWTLGKIQDTKDTYSVLKSVKSLALPSSCKPCSNSEIGKRSPKALNRYCLEELKRRHEPVFITVPTTARDSYRGKMVHVWHCVKITFMTRSMANKDIVTTVPIRVGEMSRTTQRSNDVSVAPSNFDLASVAVSSRSGTRSVRSKVSTGSAIRNSPVTVSSSDSDSLRSYNPRRKPSRNSSEDTASASSSNSSSRSSTKRTSPRNGSGSSVASRSSSRSASSRRSRSRPPKDALRVFVPSTISISEQPTTPVPPPTPVAIPIEAVDSNIPTAGIVSQ